MALILGLDPASIRNVGYGCLSVNKGKFEIVKHSTIVLPDFETDGVRLNHIYGQIDALLEDIKPDRIVIERSTGFGKSFVRSNLQESVGVMKYCAHKWDIPVTEISPTHMKLILCGNGKAKKAEVKKWSKELLGLKKKASEHAIDAMGLAYTWAVDENILEWLHKEAYEARKKKPRKKKDKNYEQLVL